MRITLTMLRARIAYLNEITNNPQSCYTRIDGQLMPNAGCYHMGEQYGGVSLDQMCSEGTGTRTIFHTTTRRDLFNQINALISGIHLARAV